MSKIIAFDIGEKRIGVAVADSGIKIPIVRETLVVDEKIYEKLAEVLAKEKIAQIVVGLPRNAKGEETKQTEFARNFAEQIVTNLPIAYQDESLTSVLGEENLQAVKGKDYQKGEIDGEAARLILADYLEHI
jgi:putative Holliday junction resolvase